ncbi:MAG: hypothetical protein ACEPO8_05275 [Rhodothermaceae bacterium]
MKKNSDYRFYINKRGATISIQNLKNNSVNGFSFKGKGYKYCSQIDGFTVLDSSFVIYDSAWRKFLEYDFRGNYIYGRTNENTEFPYSINSAVAVDSLILVTGINYRGWENFRNGISYPNLFLIDVKNNKLHWQQSLFQASLARYKRDDVNFHPQMNAQEIKKMIIFIINLISVPVK